MESGIGMPSISRWAKKQMETVKSHTSDLTKVPGAKRDKIVVQQNVGTALDKA